jgi:hypothetical protein
MQPVLYVRANTVRFDLYGLFDPASLYVLEVFAPYVQALRASETSRTVGVIQGNVLSCGCVAGMARHAPSGRQQADRAMPSGHAHG